VKEIKGSTVLSKQETYSW